MKDIFFHISRRIVSVSGNVVQVVREPPSSLEYSVDSRLHERMIER